MVATAFFWPNQLNSVPDGHSYERGFIMGREHTEHLMRELRRLVYTPTLQQPRLQPATITPPAMRPIRPSVSSAAN